MVLKRLLILLLITTPIFAQSNIGGGGNGLVQTTIPIASMYAIKGNIVGITNGSSTTDCLTGSGSDAVACIYSGSSWAAVSASGGMVYPAGTGIPEISSGSSWGTTISPGTGVVTALGNAVSGSGGICLQTNCSMTTPSLGIPSSATLTNATGLPIAGLTGLGTGVATALGNAVSGSGDFCLTTNCVMTTPNLGTPSTINLTNATSPPTWNQNTTGNAATATNLSSYPTLCSGGQFSEGLSSGSNNCATPSGSGNVSTSGSPAEYETAVWASGTSILGVGPGTSGYPLVSAGSSSNPSFAQLTSTGLNITTTSCSSQVVTAISSGGVGTCTSLTTGYLPALFQTNSSNNSTDTNINMETSTANAVGLTVTPTNSSGAIEKFEITGSSYTGNAATVTTAASTTNSNYSILSVPSTSGSQEPYTVASFTINPSTGAVNIPGALTVSSCSGCGSVSLSFPLTVSGTTTQYHFPVFATTTSLANDSTLSDNGTTLTYTGTGGIASSGPLALGSSPPTACGTVAGCVAFNEGGTAATPTTGEDYIRASSSHYLVASLDDGSETPIPLLAGQLGGTAASPTVTGLTFGSTSIATTSTAPTSGQCLEYNGTGITGASCSGGGGPTVEVNGSSSGLTSTVNFNSTTPAAGSNNQNLTLQVSTDNVSIEVPQATTSQAGVVELAGALAGTYTSPALANSTSCSNQVVTAISSSTAAGTCTSLTEAYMPVVNTVVDTSSTVTVSTINAAEFHFNENSTAATAVTYDLPTAAAGKQFCFSNAYNGSGANTGTLTLQTSASGQYIIFTDGTLSASDGYVISGGAARDSACVVGVDSTHWALYTQSGTWTKH